VGYNFESSKKHKKIKMAQIRSKIVRHALDAIKSAEPVDFSEIIENKKFDVLSAMAKKNYARSSQKASNLILKIGQKENIVPKEKPSFGECFIVRLVENNSLGMLYSCTESSSVSHYFVSFQSLIASSFPETELDLCLLPIFDVNKSVDRISTMVTSLQFLPVKNKKPFLVRIRLELGVIVPLEILDVDSKISCKVRLRKISDVRLSNVFFISGFLSTMTLSLEKIILLVI
jgi:hypothetical protein